MYLFSRTAKLHGSRVSITHSTFNNDVHCVLRLCGSGVYDILTWSLSWAPLRWYLKARLGWKIHFLGKSLTWQQDGAGCWLWALVPPHMGFFLGLFQCPHGREQAIQEAMTEKATPLMIGLWESHTQLPPVLFGHMIQHGRRRLKGWPPGGKDHLGPSWSLVTILLVPVYY